MSPVLGPCLHAVLLQHRLHVLLQLLLVAVRAPAGQHRVVPHHQLPVRLAARQRRLQLCQVAPPRLLREAACESVPDILLHLGCTPKPDHALEMIDKYK